MFGLLKRSLLRLFQKWQPKIKTDSQPDFNRLGNSPLRNDSIEGRLPEVVSKIPGRQSLRVPSKPNRAIDFRADIAHENKVVAQQHPPNSSRHYGRIDRVIELKTQEDNFSQPSPEQIILFDRGELPLLEEAERNRQRQASGGSKSGQGVPRRKQQPSNRNQINRPGDLQYKKSTVNNSGAGDSKKNICSSADTQPVKSLPEPEKLPSESKLRQKEEAAKPNPVQPTLPRIQISDDRYEISHQRVAVAPKEAESGKCRSARKSHRPKSTKTVIIGFDYGTHSTKVVARERQTSSSEATIIAFDEHVRRKRKGYQYPPSASPSLVCVDDGRLYFGTTALKRKTGTLFRSLKVDLIPGFERPEEQFPESLNAKILICCYLTWAFQQTSKKLGKFKHYRKILNISAPMDHIGSDTLRQNYMQIIHAAWNLSFGQESEDQFDQGISIEDARRLVQPFLDEDFKPSDELPYGVLAETIAPLVSISLNPLSESGLYAVVDIGAATTEVSIFHLSENGFDQRVLCYQDTSRLMGGNDIGNNDSSEDVLKLLGSLRKQFQSTWIGGFKCDKGNRTARNRWEELTILNSGGGTLTPEVTLFLSQFNPKAAYESQGDLIGPVTNDRHVPSGLSCSRKMSEEDLSLYAVANGLAIDEANWPEIHEDAPELEPTESTSKPLAYWYLND